MVTRSISNTSHSMTTRKSRRPSTVMIILLGLFTIFYLPVWIHVHLNNDLSSTTGAATSALVASLESFVENSSGDRRVRQSPALDHLGKAPASSRVIQQLEDRIRYLETKLNAYLSYTSDPFLSMKSPAHCDLQKGIKEIACVNNPTCALDSQVVCLDTFPNVKIPGGTFQQRRLPPALKEKPCVVYDFGIRESPEFGLAFTHPNFGQCQVVGFDPSPISVEWWKNNKQAIKAAHPTYQYMPVGAGGIDGPLELREYDWGQVSILEYPTRVVDTNNCTAGGCRYKFYKQQQSFFIPVKTLTTVMKELGHDHVTLLKLDVEGSEYMFLERMIDDLSCRQVDQITLEWHHYDYDRRYGVTSNPQVNVLVALLKDRCGLEQYWGHGSKGWPSNQKIYAEMGMNLYYYLSSFKRTRWDFD